MSITSFRSTFSNATAAANNTIVTLHLGPGPVRRIHYLLPQHRVTPTSVIASQQFPGPYRDALLGRQPLAI